MLEAIVMLLIFGALIYLFRGIGLWSYFFASLALLVAGFEGASYLILHKTLTQTWWAYMVDHVAGGWLRLGLILFAIVVLIVHLVWKQIRRKA